jgi:predicted ATPase
MRYISKIIIKKLWGDPDLNIEWSLNPDVNVLAGDNGSGKSTVLDLTAGLIAGNYAHKIDQKADSVQITFNTGEEITYQNIKDSIKNLEFRAKSDKSIKNFISEVKKREGNDYKKINSIQFGKFSFEKLKGEREELLKTIDIISTFDQALIKDFNETQEQVSSLKEIRTQLDLDIHELQQKYNAYITNIGNLAAEALFDETATALAQKEIVKQLKDKQNVFFDMVDNLFKNTNKTINRKNTTLSFTNNSKKEISVQELSSGEKQLLIILLTALVRENQPCIMFMDEPELSLHTDWQRTLIDNIRILNEQVQLIIATHAPLLIVNGWAGNVQQMDKIITPKPTK